MPRDHVVFKTEMKASTGVSSSRHSDSLHEILNKDTHGIQIFVRKPDIWLPTWQQLLYQFSMSEFVALHRGPPPMPVRTAHRQLNQQQPMNIIETGIESGTMRLRTIGSSQQATALEIETSAQRHL